MSKPIRKHNASRVALITGVVMMCISVMLLVLTLLGNVMGEPGQWIKRIFLGSFGFSFYASMVATLVLGFFVARGFRPTLSALKILCVLGMYYLVVMILQLITSASFLRGLTYGEYLSQCFENTSTFGGALAGVFVYPTAVVSAVASYIVYVILIIILVFAWTDFALFRRAKGNSAKIKNQRKQAEHPETSQVIAAKGAKQDFVRSPNHVAPTAMSDVGTHSLFVDEIRPVKRAAPPPMQAPRYMETGEPIRPVNDVSSHGKLYDALNKPSSQTSTAYMPDYITKKAEVAPTQSHAPSVPMPYVLDARPAQVVHTQSERPSSIIINGESRSKELDALREREEKIAAAERRLAEAGTNQTTAAMPQRGFSSVPQSKIIVGDDEVERLEKIRRAQADAEDRFTASKPSEVKTLGVAPSPVSQAPIIKTPRLFATPVHEEPHEPNEIISAPSPSLFDRMNISSVSADSEERSTETTPTDGFDFNRVFGLASQDAQSDKAPQMPKKEADKFDISSLFGCTPTPSAIAKEATDISLDDILFRNSVTDIPPIMVANPTKDETEDEFGEDELVASEPAESTVEPQYIPPTSLNIKKSVAASTREIARQQLGLDDYMQNSAVEELGTDINLDMYRTAGTYIYPPVDLLENSSTYSSEVTEECIDKGQMLVDKLQEFKIDCKISGICRGPAVSRYEIQMADGVPVSKIKSRSEDIAYTLAAKAGVRIETPIPGKRAVGVEVPNDTIGIVSLREIMESNNFTNAKSPLSFALGTDVAGEKIVCDLAKMPHLLIAGATGSGKSSCLNSLIVSLISRVTPDDVRMILIDPKRVEFSIYNGLPHMLLDSAITEWENALNALNWLILEYERRYKIFSTLHIRNISEYRKLSETASGEREKMPYIVLVIDEMADLMSNNKNDFEDKIRAVAQKARAAGIHMIVATQRPSVDIITGTIKANLTSRIAFSVTSLTDSRTILDQSGAENLLGRGDMLYAPMDKNEPTRVQGAYVTDEECHAVVNFIKAHNESVFDSRIHDAIYPQKAPIEDILENNALTSSSVNPLEDELLLPVLWFFIETGKSSISSVQRKFRVGFNRAANIVDELEVSQYIGSDGVSKDRIVLVSREQFIAKFGEPTWL